MARASSSLDARRAVPNTCVDHVSTARERQERLYFQASRQVTLDELFTFHPGIHLAFYLREEELAMSDPDHDLCATICRQAAMPVLRQHLDTEVPREQEAVERDRQAEDPRVEGSATRRIGGD